MTLYHIIVLGQPVRNSDGSVRYFEDRKEVDSIVKRFGGTVVENSKAVTLEQVLEEVHYNRRLIEKLICEDNGTKVQASSDSE